MGVDSWWPMGETLSSEASIYTSAELVMSSDQNPYASPDPSSYVPSGAIDTSRPSGPRFESGHQRAVLVMGLLVIGMLTDIMGVGSGYMELNLYKRIQAGQAVTDAEIDQSDQRQVLIGLLQMGVYFVTVILFLMWFHRAHRNLPSLGAKHLKFSPGWAVGGFFVPFLNLVRPYHVMKEVRAGSDPSTVGGSASWGSALVGLWWTGWIVMGIVSQISFRMSINAEQIQSFISANQVTLAADVISIPAAILALLVVRGIDADQQSRHELLNPGTSATMTGY